MSHCTHVSVGVGVGLGVQILYASDWMRYKL